MRDPSERVLNLSGPVAVLLGHTTVTLVLLTAGYFVVPFDLLGQGAEGWWRLVVSLALLAALVVLFRLHLRRSAQQGELMQVQWLLAALYMLVLAFAMAYAVAERIDHAQFAELSSRMDALYLSANVVSTVGMGDVHATGTVGRVLVTLQMVVDVVYIGTAVRLLTTLGRSPRS
ncbi:MAG TPA: potassium channel family protein [Marmoricola sp.]|nr:potassium channel family protein [Marmoricola sp.]